MQKPLIDSFRYGNRRRTRRRGALTLVLVALVLTLLIPFSTIVRSSDKKPSPDPHQEISPMGAIMRGDVPIPTRDAILRSSRRLPRRSTTGIQGDDILVHDPMAIDYQSENTIAKNGNFIVIGYNDVRGFYLPTVSVSGYAYSSDGGMTWTDGGQMPTYGTGDAVYGDPDVKTWTDPNTSQVYFFYASIYVDVNGVRSLSLHVSTDGGATWALPRPVTTATSSTDVTDKEFLCVDPETGRIFVSWTNFGSGTTMRVTYSDDLGLTWQGLESFGSSGQGSVPRADGSSDNVYMVWRRSGDIQFAVSTNNGASWSGPDKIIDHLTNPMNPYGSDRIHGFPGMDVDNANGNVYIVYASRDDPPDFSDVYFSRSTDEGGTWSNPVALNAYPGNDRSQFFPWISVDQSTGRIDVIWYDQVNGTGTSDLTEIMHVHSNDGGLSWSCPTPLTDAPFHAEYGNTRSQPNIGDYIQCVSDNGFLYAAFARTDEPSYLTYAPDTYIDVAVGAGSDAPIAFVGTSIGNDAGCVTGNGIAESWETIDLTVTVKNYSTCTSAITGIAGTLSTSTSGVTITSPFQGFGNLSAVGSTAFNSSPFLLELDPAFDSGEDIDLLLTLTSSAGLARIPFHLATGDPAETTLLTEDFDGVSAPALPAGWSSDHVDGTGTLNPWVTSTTYSASGANSAFCADISSTSHNRLQSPSIVIPAGADLVDVTFDVTHDIEADYERKVWDGALLRVEVDDGIGVTTVLAGAFATLFEPFYPWQMNRQSRSSQPLEDLACWGDKTTPNFSPVHLQFPGLAGTTIRLFWDMGTDTNTGTSTGMFVDNVVVKSIEKPSVCTDPPAMAAAPSPVEFFVVPAGETTCDSIFVVNQGPSPLTITGISGCTTSPFGIDTSMTSHSVAPGDTTRMLVCVMPTQEGPFDCTVTIHSNATNSPLMVPVNVNTVTGVGPGDIAATFEILGVAPNPFNPSTIVRFTLPRAMTVTAEVVAINGATVRSLAEDEPFERGENRLEWDGRNDGGFPVASGVYFVRVRTPVGTKIARAVMLK